MTQNNRFSPLSVLPLRVLTFIVLATVILGILLLSCSNQEFAIFYYIENEEEQKDESLENELSIISMVKDGSFYYIAAGGDIFRRMDTSDNWDSLKFPSGADYCTALTLFDPVGPEPNMLYAGFLEGSSTFRFYKGTPSTNPNWQRVTDSKIDGKQVIRAEVITGSGPTEQLFVITFDDEYYSLFWSDDGTNYYDGILDEGKMIRNVTYNPAGPQFYWVVTDDGIYTKGDDPLNNLDPEFDPKPDIELPPENGGYRGIYYSTIHNKYYVSTLEGVISSSSDGDSWESSGTKSVAGQDVQFWFFGEVDNRPALSESNVLVGSVGYGFFEMPDGEVASLDRMSEFIATELYYGWVTGFFTDYGATPLVFVYTAGSGLWRNEYTFPGEWGQDWTWE